MRIGILTYYGVHSHGAVLQANALKTVLNSMGHEVEFLRFERNYDLIPSDQSKKYRISMNSIPFYTKYLFQKGPTNIIRNIQKNSTLNKYRNENFVIKRRYSDFDGDLVIIGSDEVFSLEIGINPFMYGHGLHNIDVLSYAGCFGPTTLEDVKQLGLEALISSGLKSMKSISVRDENSQSIVYELTGRHAELVCDPVILHGYKEQLSIGKPRTDKYILIYSYDRNMNEISETDKIVDFAKKNEMKIIAVGYPHKWCDEYLDVNPNELINYINFADYVITDTFHGAVLSIISNTQFVVKLRGNKNKLEFLLNQYGLEERIIDKMNDIENVVKSPINYVKVNDQLVKQRKKSYEFLKDSLSLNS